MSRDIARAGFARLRARIRSTARQGTRAPDLAAELSQLRSSIEAQSARIDRIASTLVDLDGAVARRTTTVIDAVSTRHADMWDLVNRNQSATETTVATRHEDLWGLIDRHHQDDWQLLTHISTNTDIDALRSLILQLNADAWTASRRLHDSLMRRLADVERQVRAAQPSSGARAHPTADEVRDALRRYLDDSSVDRTMIESIQSTDPRQRCPSKLGEMELLASDTVIAPYLREHGEWEAEVEATLRKTVNPGDVVIEIGAHVGYFAVLLAELTSPGGRVVAIEADPRNAKLLEANTSRLAVAPVLPLWLAATDRTGPVTLSRSPEANSGDARIFDWPISGDVEDVAGFALDEVWPSDAHVDFVLVDVQGFDHVALSGFISVITRCRPTLLVEYWPDAIVDAGDDPASVLELFQSWGYEWTATEDAAIGPATSITDLVDAATQSTTGFLNLLLTPRP